MMEACSTGLLTHHLVGEITQPLASKHMRGTHYQHTKTLVQLQVYLKPHICASEWYLN